MRRKQLFIKLDHDGWVVDAGIRACLPAMTVAMEPHLAIDRCRFDQQYGAAVGVQGACDEVASAKTVCLLVSKVLQCHSFGQTCSVFKRSDDARLDS